eukprot:TRINITY_DN82_c1_g1_i1.p1 TRINITY_DN82_c1_g1~~TRINITY_DN82_c1_g1_i1.p1  ORF type:complete len:393 (+),score=42.37 TRINITY_DN82_c1_g1_i1:497-1675(+)
MLAFILYSHLSSIGHPWNTYISTLPADALPMLAYWSPEVLNKIRSSTLIQQAAATGELYRRLHSEIVDRKEDEKEFSWALQMATSRHVIFPDELTAKKEFEMFMCPIVDLLNHSFEPNAVVVPEFDVSLRSGCFCLRSLKKIEKDEQITISYGDHSNLTLVQRYGFVVENNKNSCIPLIFDSEKYQEIMQDSVENKLQIISKGLKSSLKKANGGYIYQNRMEGDLMAKLRVWMLTNQEINKIGVEELTKMNFKQKISAENEARTLDCMKEILVQKRELLGNTDYALEKKKVDRFRSIENYNLYNLYLLEEEEKQILENALKFVSRLEAQLQRAYRSDNLLKIIMPSYSLFIVIFQTINQYMKDSSYSQQVLKYCATTLLRLSFPFPCLLISL